MEVIVAVAIVAVMAGALAPVVFHEINAARNDATAREMARLQDGLLEFYEDTGRFPTQSEGLAALIADPGVTGWRGPYVDGGQRNPFTEVASDAFGESYTYVANPTAVPATSADIILASAGVNRRQDMPDQGQTWVLANVADHDDLVHFVSVGRVNRDKEDESVAELEALADAARAHYLDLGTFPGSLTDLRGDYLDGGYENDAFIDEWNSNYLSTILGGGSPVLRIWSPGPNRQNQNGGGDDLMLEVNSAALN